MINYIYKLESALQRLYNNVKIILYGSRGKILVFHEINLENYKNTEPSCFCSIEKFRKTMMELKSNYCFCTIDDLMISNGNKIVVTFDDVPISVYQNAYPILKELDIPFTLYLSPKFIGKDGFMSEDQIRELDNEPLCTIGAHTMNHVKLRYEKDSYHDIYNSKIAVEKIIGHSIKHLAYPFGRAGSISHKVRKEARKAGFETAVSTIPTKVPRLLDRWYLPRIAVC